MRKRFPIAYLFLIPVILICGSCNNDLDLDLPYEPVPLVYGMISPDDSFHTVRLGLSSPGIGETDDFQTDSLKRILTNAEVYLELRSHDGTVIERSRLSPTGESGISGNPDRLLPFCLFSSPGMKPVVSGTDMPGLYSVTVSLPSLKRFVYAETMIPQEPEIILSNSLHSGEPVNLFAAQGSNEAIIVLPDTLSIEFKAVIRYSEQTGGLWNHKSILYSRQYGSATRSSHNRFDSFQLDENWFFTQVSSHIFVDKKVEQRKFESIDLSLTYISGALDQYKRALGFSSDFVQGGYSNIVSGIGLFISFNAHEYKGFTLNGQSMDSLVGGICTRNLGFRMIR